MSRLKFAVIAVEFVSDLMLVRKTLLSLYFSLLMTSKIKQDVSLSTAKYGHFWSRLTTMVTDIYIANLEATTQWVPSCWAHTLERGDPPLAGAVKSDL